MSRSRVNNVRRRRSKARNEKRVTDIVNGGTIFRMIQGKPHSFIRVVNNGEVIIGAGDQGYATVFALSFVPSASDFTNLFDQYQISKVEFIFELDIADGALNSTTKWPRITIAPDFNNQSAPLSETDVLQYEQVRQYQFSTSERRFAVTLNPMIANTIFRTGVTSAYQMVNSGWLDVATPDVPHYGLRYFIANHNATSFGSSRIRTYTRYWMSFRNAS